MNELAEETEREIHVQIYDEMEQIYLDTNVRLKHRIEELKIRDVSGAGNNQEQILETNPMFSREENFDGQIGGRDGVINETGNVQNGTLPPAQQAQMQPIILQCPSARQVENTWGEFNGDLSNWQTFHDGFNSTVHESNMSNIFKFQHLKTSLKGRAAAAIGEWQLTNNNYSEAWERLKQLYSRPYQTSKELLWKFYDLPKLERASGGMIQKFSNTTHEVMRSLGAMNYSVEHLDIIFVHGLHDRLDHETSVAWELQRSSEHPPTTEILDFLDRQAKALLGAQFVDKKGLNEHRKRQTFTKNERIDYKRAKPESTKTSTTDMKPEFRLCKICKESHPLHRCPAFLKMTLNERKKSVREHELCNNCLRPSHFSKDCFAQACVRCQLKHNSLLCPENPYNKRTVNTVQLKSDSKEHTEKKKKETKDSQ